MKHRLSNPSSDSACVKNFMISESDLNGNRQLVSHGRAYKVVLQLPFTISLNLVHCHSFSSNNNWLVALSMATPLEYKCGKNPLEVTDSSYLFITHLLIQTHTIDIKVSFAYNFSRNL